VSASECAVEVEEPWYSRRSTCTMVGHTYYIHTRTMDVRTRLGPGKGRQRANLQPPASAAAPASARVPLLGVPVDEVVRHGRLAPVLREEIPVLVTVDTHVEQLDRVVRAVEYQLRWGGGKGGNEEGRMTCRVNIAHAR